MDSTATNYNLIATEDDGLCEYGITGGKWIGTSQTYDIIITQWDSSQTNILFTMPVLETENNPDSLGIQQIKFFLNNLEVKTYTNQGLIENEGNWIEEDEGTINHSITITDDGEIIIFNVENITENNLVLSQDLDEMEYDEYDNTWMHFTGTADFSFDRDKNGFTTNNTNQRIGNTTWLNKAKLINSIKH
jgi:predicted transcriptional regulator